MGALAFSRTSPNFGTAARIVGYGQVMVGVARNAVREEATTSIAALDPGDTITVGDGQHLTCLGDSGGPAIISVGGVDQIVGVDSYTDSSGCMEAAHFQRTDVYADYHRSIRRHDAAAQQRCRAAARKPTRQGGNPDTQHDSGGGCAAGHGTGIGLAFALAGLPGRRRK